MSEDKVETKTWECGCQERYREGFPVEMRPCLMHMKNPNRAAPKKDWREDFR